MQHGFTVQCSRYAVQPIYSAADIQSRRCGRQDAYEYTQYSTCVLGFSDKSPYCMYVSVCLDICTIEISDKSPYCMYVSVCLDICTIEFSDKSPYCTVCAGVLGYAVLYWTVYSSEYVCRCSDIQFCMYWGARIYSVCIEVLGYIL